MELREAIASFQKLDLVIDPEGVLRDPQREDLWYGVVDGGTLVLANCMKNSGLSEVDLDDVTAFGILESYVLTIEIDGEWDFCNASPVNLNPPPARRCEDPIPDDIDIIDIDELNKHRRAGLREFCSLFPLLFPEAEQGLYYDLLKESIMVDMAMLGRPKRGVQRITDRIAAVYHLVAEEALHRLGVKTEFSKAVMDEALMVWGEDHQRNNFKIWVEGLKWDGKPRMATMFRDLLGAKAPALSPADEERYLAAVSRAWLTGAIARCYGPAKHEIVPVLISKQGLGKGTALCLLAGRDEWFKDVAISPRNIEKFLDAVRGRIIVELSEATALRADVDALKAFITQREDQMRKAYGHFEETYPRHFIMAASTNNPSIFTDVTGNRRFFPMYCDASRAIVHGGSEGREYVEQLWAEVFHEYHNGAKHYMTRDEQDLAEPMQDYAAVENGNVIAIDEYLDEPLNGLTAIGSRVSRAFIMEKVFGYSGSLVPKELETAYRAWTMGTKRWEKAPGTIRIDGKPAKGYVRICKPGEIPKAERLPVTMDEVPGSLMEEFEKLTRNKQEGDVLQFERFYVKDMSRERAIDALMEEGYIYPYSSHGVEEYRLAIKPEQESSP